MTEVRYGVVRTTGFVAWAIRVATRSTVNHAFVVNGPTIIEANPGGLAYGKVAKYYPAAILSNPITGEQADAVWAWSKAHLGAKYGFLDIAAIALFCSRIPTPKWALERLEGTDTLICSQAVAAAYAAAGISLGNKPPALTTPGDLLHLIRKETEPAYY